MGSRGPTYDYFQAARAVRGDQDFVYLNQSDRFEHLGCLGCLGWWKWLKDNFDGDDLFGFLEENQPKFYQLIHPIIASSHS